MKKVYIFFLSTPFKTGKTIQFLTGHKYNHVAFSFEKSGDKLYSYARYRYHEPFLSGFGIENTDRYAPQINDTHIKICEYEVSDEHYRRIRCRIRHYEENRRKSTYNFLDILCYPFNIHLKLAYTHTCISFLLELLERRDVHTIGQLERKLKNNVIYEGCIGDYCEKLTSGTIDFYEKRSLWNVIDETKNRAWLVAFRLLGFIKKKVL